MADVGPGAGLAPAAGLATCAGGLGAWPEPDTELMSSAALAAMAMAAAAAAAQVALSPSDRGGLPPSRVRPAGWSDAPGALSPGKDAEPGCRGGSRDGSAVRMR